MSRFGNNPHEFFTHVYESAAPWDVGEAQPALTALFDAFPPASPVLDVGCGTGDLAIALARRGLSVLGVDFVEAAISEANARAAQLPVEVQNRLAFQVGDALRPSALKRLVSDAHVASTSEAHVDHAASPAEAGPGFGAIVDSGFLHLFDAPERDAFVTDLAHALRPGGRYYLLAFAVTFPAPNVPREVTEQEVRDRFAVAAGWRILHCAPASFASRVASVPAVAACIERIG